MKLIIGQLAEQAGIDSDKIDECKPDIVKGIYEAYLQTNDKVDTIDSLQRAVRKISRTSSPR